MPYIEVKLAKQASRKQERILTEKLGEAITSVRERQQPGLWYPFLLMNTFIKVENF